jgi:hypothetical protein
MDTTRGETFERFFAKQEKRVRRAGVKAFVTSGEGRRWRRSKKLKKSLTYFPLSLLSPKTQR